MAVTGQLARHKNGPLPFDCDDMRIEDMAVQYARGKRLRLDVLSWHCNAPVWESLPANQRHHCSTRHAMLPMKVLSHRLDKSPRRGTGICCTSTRSSVRAFEDASQHTPTADNSIEDRRG